MDWFKRWIVVAVVVAFAMVASDAFRTRTIRDAWRQSTEGVSDAKAYSGSFALWAQKKGEFLSTNFAGSTAGRDAGYAYLGEDGFMQMGHGSENVPFGTIPLGVNVVRSTYLGYDVAGRPFRWFDRIGNQKFRADSSGVNIVGKAVVSDSLNAAKGMYVGGEFITKIKRGTFVHDFGPVSNGTTLDETQSVSGLDLAGNWTVVVQPLSANMSAGLAIASVRVSADNQLTIRLQTTCSQTVDNPSMTFSYIAYK